MRNGYVEAGNRYTLFCAASFYALCLWQIIRIEMAKRIRISNESLNCYGTWVKTEGADCSQFEKNPVLLYMHWRGMIIGNIKNFKVENGEITGEPYFDEVRDESKIAKQQYEKGTLVMCSANFEVLELSEEPTLLKPGQTRPTVTKCKLVEVSMVDIGGNDDALVLLSYQGKELKLAAGEDCAALPLLKTNSGDAPLNNNPQTETEMTDFKAIALKLGLPETATENEVLTSIGILLGYKTANETLQQEKETLQLAGITQVVDGAIGAHKITAEKKAHFITLGKTVGIESLKLTFDAMNAVVKPTDIIGSGASMTLAGAGGDWKKLSDVPSEKLMELRDNDKPSYMKLYRAEYGVDCPKY